MKKKDEPARYENSGLAASEVKDKLYYIFYFCHQSR